MSNAIAWVAAGLGFLLVLVTGIEELRIHNWESDYKTQAAELRFSLDDLATARVNIVTLRTAIDKQNADIKKMAQDALDAKNAAEARVKVIDAANRKKTTVKVGYGPKALNDWMNREYGGVE